MPLSRSLQAVFVAFFLSAYLTPLTTQAQKSEPAPKDLEAVAVLNQVLAVAGGSQAITAIKDYTANGEESYGKSAVLNPVTFTVRGFGDFRRESLLSTGKRTWVTSNGKITEKEESGGIRLVRAQAPTIPSSLILPYQWPLAALHWPQLKVSHQGTAQLKDRAVIDIRLQEVSQQGLNQTTDIFVDASNFQIVVIRESIGTKLPTQLSYSNYRVVNGVLIPFTIREELPGRPYHDVQLNQIDFNAGLTKESFQEDYKQLQRQRGGVR